MPAPFFPGFTEDDDPNRTPSFDQTVADVLQQQPPPAPPPPPQYVGDPDAGNANQPQTVPQESAPVDNSTYFDQPSQVQTQYVGDPDASAAGLTGAPLPPPPPSGQDFFADAQPTGHEASLEQPTSNTTYVSNEDWFSADHQQNLYNTLFDQQVGPPPTLGDGSQWFDPNPDKVQQQLDWWQSEMTRAQLAGDQEKIDALNAEMQRVRGQYNDYYGYYQRPLSDAAMQSGDGYVPGLLDQYYNQAQTFDHHYQQGLDYLRSTDPSAGAFTPGEGPQTRLSQLMPGGDPNTLIPVGYVQSLSMSSNPGYRDAYFQAQAEQQMANTLTQKYGYQYAQEGQAHALTLLDTLAGMHKDTGTGLLGTVRNAVEQVNNATNPSAQFFNLIGRKQSDVLLLPEVGIQALRTLNNQANPSVLALRSLGLDNVNQDIERAGELIANKGMGLMAVPGQVAWNGTSFRLGGREIAFGGVKQAIADEVTYWNDLYDNLKAGKIALPNPQDQMQEAVWLRERQEVEHPYLNMIGSMVVDPTWLIGTAEWNLPGRLKAARVASTLVKDAFSEDELARIAATNPTLADKGAMVTAKQGAVDALGIPTTDKLGQALASRIGYGIYFDRLEGGSNAARIAQQEVANLPELAKTIGASDADVTRLQNILRGKNAAALNDVALAAAFPEIAAFPEVTPFTQQSARVDQVLDYTPRVDTVETLHPPAPSPEMQASRAVFESGNTTLRDWQIDRIDLESRRTGFNYWRRLTNAAPEDLPRIYEQIRDEKAVTLEQKKTAGSFYEQGKMPKEDYQRIVNNQVKRDEAEKIINQAGWPKQAAVTPDDMARAGLVRVGPDNPNYEQAVNTARTHYEARQATVEYLFGNDTQRGVIWETQPHPHEEIGKTNVRARNVASKATQEDVGYVKLLPGTVVDLLSNSPRVEEMAVGSPLRQWAEEMRSVAKFPRTSDGLLSSTTVNAKYQYLMDALPELLLNGTTDIEDVQRFKGIFDDYLTTSRLEQQAATRTAEASKAVNPTVRMQEEEIVARKKAENGVLRQQLDEALARGDQQSAKRIRDQMGANTRRIKRSDPSYTNTSVPRATPAEAVAANDAKVNDALARSSAPDAPPEAVAPSSDPVTAHLTQPTTDSTNDLLGKLVDGAPTIDKPSPVLQPAAEEVGQRVVNEPAPAPAGTRSIKERVRQRDQDTLTAWARDFQSGKTTVLPDEVAAAGKRQSAWSYWDANNADKAAAILEKFGTGGQEVGILPDAFARYINGQSPITIRDNFRVVGNVVRYLRPTKPILDTNLQAWRLLMDNATPETFARLDEQMAKFYRVEDYVKPTGAQKFNPATLANLTAGSHVAKTGDLIEMGMFPLVEDAFKSGAYAHPDDAIVANLKMLIDPSTPSEAIRAFSPDFLDSKTGLEMLRAFRKHGPELLSNWQKGVYDPHLSLGWFADLAGVPADGKFYATHLKQLDSLIMGDTYPKGLSASDKARLDNLRGMLRENWTQAREAFGYDPITNRFTETFSPQHVQGMAGLEDQIAARQSAINQLDKQIADAQRELQLNSPHDRAALVNQRNDLQYQKKVMQADLRDDQQALARMKKDKPKPVGVDTQVLNAALFPEEMARPYDPMGMAQRMGADAAALEAERIGYDPFKLSADQKVMRVIKGNLTPLWMTENPGYHIRNFFGNISAQLVSALRSDSHVGFNPFAKNDLALKAFADEGSGLAWHPWTEQKLSNQAGAEIAESKGHLIPKIIEAKGYNPWHAFWQGVGDFVEPFSKEVTYSQEVGWTYADQWSKRLDKLDFLTDEQRTALRSEVGLKNVNLKAADLGLSDAERNAVLAQQRATISVAHAKGYQTAAETLRDYRMRNRFDGILDRIFPVHFWTTKNALFIGKSLVDKPALALAGMRMFDTFQEQHKDLPKSLRQSLHLMTLPDWVPVLGGQDFYIRPASYVNPLLAGIPQLISPDNYDMTGTSLKDRVVNFGTGGLENGYNAMGYRVGPQWDIALKLAARGAELAVGDNKLSSLANAITGNSAYHTQLLPFGLANEQDIAALGRKLTGKDLQPYIEQAYTLIYGQPYTRLERARFSLSAADMWQTGQINQSQYRVIEQALLDGKYDYDPDYLQQVMNGSNDPKLTEQQAADALKMVRGIVDGVADSSAMKYTLSSLGLSGNTLSKETQKQRAAQANFDAIANEDLATLKLLHTVDGQFNDLVKNVGLQQAFAWAADNAPWLTGYWNAYDDTAKARQLLNLQVQDVRDRANADYLLRSQQYAEKATASAPYYDHIDRINEAADKARARAGGNMLLVDQAEKYRQQQINQVYSDAAAAGVDMTGSGRLPQHGPSWYDQHYEGQKFLAMNDVTPQDIDRHETFQKQRGYLLDLVKDQLLPPKYVDGELNPLYLDDNGRFSQQKYDQAVADAAAQAPDLYREYALKYASTDEIDHKGAGLLLSETLNTPVTPADFLYHVSSKDADLDAFRQQRQDDLTAFYNMPSGPEKDAEKQRLLDTYGRNLFVEKNYQDGGGYTQAENADYGNAVNAIRDWYYTLSPKDKADFKRRYGSAFVQKTDANGDTYDSFVATNLTGDQANEIVSRNRLQVGVQGDTPMGGGQGRMNIHDTPQAIGSEAARGERAVQVQQLNDQYDAVLNEDDKQALNAFYAVKDDPRFAEAKGLQQTAGSWRKAKAAALNNGDQQLADLIDAYLSAVEQASPVFDKQSQWFQNLPSDQQQLLITEDPARFGKYGDPQASNPASSSSSTSSTKSTSSSTSTSKSSSTYVPKSSSGSSSTPSSRTSYSSSYVPYSSSSSSAASSSKQPSAVYHAVAALDPVLSTGAPDDGRGILVQQVANQMTALFAFITDKRLLGAFQGLMYRWVQQQLGPNPTLASWQHVLDLMRHQQQGYGTPPAQPVMPPPGIAQQRPQDYGYT